MDASASICFPSVEPIIRFPPPLSTLLKLNRDEIPLELSHVSSVILPLSAEELNIAALSHADVTPEPINDVQAKKYAAYRTVSKKFASPVMAIAHALFSDVRRANELILPMRRLFLGPDGSSNLKKRKVKLEAILYTLCKANDGTIDIVVITPFRDSASLYTSFNGYVLHEDDNDSSTERRQQRTLVVIEYDAEMGMWSPVEYSLRYAAAPTGVATAPPLNGGAPRSHKRAPIAAESVAESGDEATAQGYPKVSRATAPVDDGEVNEARADVLEEHPPFDVLVQHADRRFHTAAQLQRMPPDGVPLAGAPFLHVKYPTIDMSDFGVLRLASETWNQSLLRALFRLLGTTICGASTAALLIALIVVLWASDLHACCQNAVLSEIGTQQCWDLNASSYLNMTLGASAEARCAANMCPASGILLRSAVWGYLYGSLLSVGRCLWLALSGSILCFAAAVMVNHFSMRPLALNRATPLFVYWLHVGHVCTSGATCAVLAYAVYQLHFLRHSDGASHSCEWFTDYRRVVCLDGIQSGCSTVVRVYLSDRQRSYGLVIAAAVTAGLQFLLSLVPTVPQEELRAVLPGAMPDTNIFSPGLFAPDGATEQDLERLQLSIKLRHLEGKDVAAWAEQLAAPSGDVPSKDRSKKGEASAARTRVAKAFQSVRRNVRSIGLLSKLKAGSVHAEGHAGSSATHYAVHDSGDIFAGHDVETFGRHMSLTFVPRKNDAAKLSGATLREVNRISSRVQAALAEAAIATGPSAFDADTQPQPTDDVTRSSKYDDVHRQLAMVQRVAPQRDAVLDEIADRLRGKRPHTRDEPDMLLSGDDTSDED